MPSAGGHMVGNQAESNNNPDQILKPMQTVRIQLPTEPFYWGSATETDVERILVNLEAMIRSEFGDRFDLQIERSNTPTGSGIQAEDQEVVEEINDWIAENWTKAL